MTFRNELWSRFEFKGTPIYVRGDKPDWFVPNEAGDKVLQEPARSGPNGLDIQTQRFLARLPDEPGRSYGGRAQHLKTDHLRELWFHITNRCNQACRHCLFASSPDEKTELAATRIREIATQATTLGCRVFALTGGEPLVHPDFESIVDGLLGPEAAHVVVLTNGTLLRGYAQALARWPADRLHLQISVDGLGHKHDRLRGRGAFDDLTANLAWLKAKRIALTLSVCVTADNAEDMPALVDFAAEAGAANLHFIWYFVRGRGTPTRFASPSDIFPRLAEAAERAAAAGVNIDNLEALRSQVFAPSGTKHDGAGSGWESLAVGPDGQLYPSPALVGVEALATPITSDLAEAWRRSPVLEELRRATAAQTSSPWRFLLGGGDPDHSYLHGGAFIGHDPYWPLYEQAAMWLIAREAAGQPADGPPRLRLKMGDILETCGAHGSVALTHTNCLLAAASPDSRTVVKEFYQAAAHTPREDILNPVCYPEEAISHIPAKYRFRGYGCGSPVLDAGLRPGETVLDLGCGAGVECFIAARLVGETGRVFGLDMLDPMLALAEQGAQGVAANLGYKNLGFKKGFLEELPRPDESIDVVLSNCVINLSGHKRRTFGEIFRVLKPGGRLVISDVVCETEPEAAVKNDAGLRGECIAGALTQGDLFGLLAESDFVAARVMKRFPYRVVQGHQFFSMTYEARKPSAPKALRVMYRGPFPAMVTGQGEILEVGVTREIALEEVPVNPEDLFVFDDAGAIVNLALSPPACCPNEASGCCPPAELGMGKPISIGASESLGCPGPEAGTGLSLKTSVLETGPVTVRRHTSDCMVCGAPLHYLQEETNYPCAFCGAVIPANARCERGHFVCDACHTRDAQAFLEHICLTTRETDMIVLLQEIRSHPAIPLHGPEHHILVPGIILATYRNLGGEVPLEMLRTALRRGQGVPGGYCAFTGACGAALGVGIAFSLLLGANPVKARERQQVQQITQAVLQEQANFAAARCCQRDSWLAIKKAAELSKIYLPIALQADFPLHCRQAHQNRECLGIACPLWEEP
jgi:MoaA/NifB/PqqE/SkfB family radical SAM enzyme/SAM-dependent methyltransferase